MTDVDHTDAETLGMATPGQDQSGKPVRDGHCEPGGNGDSLPRLHRDRISGLKIDGGIADMRPCGNFHFRSESYETSLHLGVTGRRAG